MNQVETESSTSSNTFHFIMATVEQATFVIHYRRAGAKAHLWTKWASLSNDCIVCPLMLTQQTHTQTHTTYSPSRFRDWKIHIALHLTVLCTDASDLKSAEACDMKLCSIRRAWTRTQSAWEQRYKTARGYNRNQKLTLRWVCNTDSPRPEVIANGRGRLVHHSLPITPMCEYTITEAWDLTMWSSSKCYTGIA